MVSLETRLTATGTGKKGLNQRCSMRKKWEGSVTKLYYFLLKPQYCHLEYV